MTRDPLRLLRRRLTAWYVLATSVILLAVGTGLYLSVRRHLAEELDLRLESTVQGVGRATGIRLAAGEEPAEAVRMAVEEFAGPDRLLFLFDARGEPVLPADPAEPGIRSLALRAGGKGATFGTLETEGGQVWRALAAPLGGDRGSAPVVVALAELSSVEQQYARLVELFVGAGLLALIPIGLGGYRLARLSTRPVERSMEQMRHFTADAAHELRTPVSVIRGRVEVALQQVREAEEYRRVMREIAHDAERLGTVVRDLLTLVQADAGIGGEGTERVYLDDLASDAMRAAAVLARARGVHLELRRYEEVPILGNPELLRRLTLILLDNAIKFTPAGRSVFLDVHRDRGEPTIVVEDQGVGIDAGEIPHLFDRFYRGEDARGAGEGAGLGLSIARWIADLHGARIHVSSRPGEGARFSIVFPIPGRTPEAAA